MYKTQERVSLALVGAIIASPFVAGAIYGTRHLIGYSTPREIKAVVNTNNELERIVVSTKLKDFSFQKISNGEYKLLGDKTK